jgi:uncharacterized protein
MEFDWDEGNLEHIAEHNFDDVECEEVFFDKDVISAPAYSYKGEKRQAIIGKTEGGRFAYIVYTIRNAKVRVVTARNANDSEKRTYRKYNEK